MTKLEMDLQLEVADGSRMAAYAARPARETRAGVLLFQEAFGVDDHIRDVARRVAELGYLTIAPELFHRAAPGFSGDYDDLTEPMKQMRALTPAGLEADAWAAREWLLSEGCPSPRVAALGFCLGGRVALLAASLFPLAASVSYYGGVTDALLPRLPLTQCPLLLFWGGRDKHLGPDARARLTDALDAAGKEYVNVVFSWADHAFHNDARKNVYDATAARESWALTRAFLAERLGDHR